MTRFLPQRKKGEPFGSPFLFLFFILVAALAAGCAGTASCKTKPIDDCACTMIYKPVCGCDGQTYSNACTAQCRGVQSFNDGPCQP